MSVEFAGGRLRVAAGRSWLVEGSLGLRVGQDAR